MVIGASGWPSTMVCSAMPELSVVTGRPVFGVIFPKAVSVLPSFVAIMMINAITMIPTPAAIAFKTIILFSFDAFFVVCFFSAVVAFLCFLALDDDFVFAAAFFAVFFLVAEAV